MNRLNGFRRIIFATAIAAECGTASHVSAGDRGAWFWYQSSDPNGAANVVGDNAKENEAIAFMQQWQIDRLYGSYSNLTTTNAAAMAAWNKKLSLAGIESYVVISDPNLVLPSQQTNLQNLVSTRLVNFNNGRSDAGERFVGIELDLEPHTLPQWSSGTNAGRRTLVLNLRDAFATVRQRLVTGGYASSLVSAALPVWFDSSSTIGWTSSADRDQWFDDIGTSLDSISLMAYETSSIASIMSDTTYERANFDGDAVVALRSKLGEEWLSYSDFTSALTNVESQVGGGIDIESYYRLRQIAPSPAAAGDYNDDGHVDAADYSAWRKGGPLLNDPIAGATTDDYNVWRLRFGATTAGFGASVGGVPEPAAYMLISLTGLFASLYRYRLQPSHRQLY